MSEITFGEAKIKAVGDLMRADERVIIIGGAGFGGLSTPNTSPLHDEFEARILRTPIAELGFCGWASAPPSRASIRSSPSAPVASRSKPGRKFVNEAPNITYMSGGQASSRPDHVPRARRDPHLGRGATLGGRRRC